MRINVNFIKVKNFLSYGASYDTNRYDFNNGLDIILAQNGAGKSSLTLDALLYAFYGKPYRKIKLQSLQNSINTKDLEVTANFTKGDDTYEIVRGMNPSKFQIFKNSTLIDEYANVKDYQKMLEEKILETSEKTFRNLIVLGGIGITSGFMDLSSAEKEELITNIIDIKIINLLLDKIKEKTNILKTQKTELSYKIDLLSNNIKSEAQSIKSALSNDTEVQIIEFTTQDKKDLDEVIGELNKNLSKAVKVEDALDNLQAKIKETTNNINIAKKSFYVCENCKFENNLSGYNIDDLENTLKTQKENHKKLLEKHKELDEILTKNRELKEKLQTKQTEAKNSLALQKQSTQISQTILENLKENIRKNKAELDELKENLNEVIAELNKYNEMSEILGKNNIKKFIINQQIPFLNKEINEFLQLFFSDYSFYFNETLKDKVFYKSIEQDYNQLSNGQKIRICFAIMFAFIRFLENKNGTIWNILILDEVLDSALDYEGTEALLKIIQREFTHKNVVIISHNDDIKTLDIFSRKVNITRNKFSKISIEDVSSGSNNF